MSVTKFPEQLKLTAETEGEKFFLEWLKRDASDVLIEKINAGSKTMAGAMEYAKGRAEKLNTKRETCFHCPDETVYGWIVHFFEEDEIKEEPVQKPKAKAKVPGGASKKKAAGCGPKPELQKRVPKPKLRKAAR